MFTIKYERRQRRGKQVLRDDLPQEVVFDIFTRLPAKSLLRCTCVCKSWNTLVSSSSFINFHIERNVAKSSCNYLLIRNAELNCLSLFDAETFAKCLDLEPPKDKPDFTIHGSCNGLICISGVTKAKSAKAPVYLWNPSIRKLKRLPEGLIQPKSVLVALGFGFHGGANDYKVVRIQRLCKKLSVEVYSLGLNSWRKITAAPPVSQGVSLLQNRGAFLSGVVYWIAKGSSENRSFILSFDLGSEVFQKILYPDILHGVLGLITFQVFEKSLSLFHHRLDLDEGKGRYCDIWVLEADNWKMIRTIDLPEMGFVAGPLGFGTNGRVHLVMFGLGFSGDLVLHDPASHKVKNTGIKMHHSDLPYVDAYSESLILLH